MTRHALLRFLVIGSTVFSVPAGYAECECPPDSVVQAVLNADRIFTGTVVSALISEDDTETIDFVVEVRDSIRGIQNSEYRLTTQAPGACGVSVRLAFNDIYVLGPDEVSVSRCTGSGRAAHRKYPLLSLAIALVDLPESDVRGAEQLLSKRFYSGYARQAVDDFFDLVEKIDPSGNTSTRFSDRIEYRGLVIYFSEGKFDRVGLP